MTDTPKRLVALFLVATMLVAAAAGGATATAPTVNDGTIDNAVTTGSEITDGSNVTGFDANESNESVLSYQADSNNSKVELERNGSDTVVYSNSSADLLNWNNTDNDGIFNVSINHGDLEDLERGINDNVSVDVIMSNNTSVDDPDTLTIEWFVETDNSTHVENVDDADVDDGDDVDVTDDPWDVFGQNVTLGPLGSTFAEADYDDLSVDGDNTDVVLVFSNGSVADKFDDAAEDASSEDKLSTLFTNTRTAILVAGDDGTTRAVPVYYEEAPDDKDEDEDTYGVYEEGGVGGEDGVTIHLGEEFEDADEVDVRAVGSAGTFTMFSNYVMDGVGNALSMTLGGGLYAAAPFAVIAGRRCGPKGPGGLATAPQPAEV